VGYSTVFLGPAFPAIISIKREINSIPISRFGTSTVVSGGIVWALMFR
jgi:hypothetical protein